MDLGGVSYEMRMGRMGIMGIMGVMEWGRGRGENKKKYLDKP